ncbi:hypothetical protein [Streptodolium elevatio]|uniref:Transposase n=1 Tax=Streptodolium elevatio TaxID=3157996 RepID=A0ABV3DS25_9ACTN
MVTSNHEAAHRIIQEHPEVLSAIFELLCLPLPADASFTVVTPDVTEMRPVERRIDTVLRIDPPERESFLLAVESQGKKDLDKPSSWAYYVGFLAAKYKLPVMLLVVSQNRATSRWARGPFGFGPEGCHTLTLHPATAGPDNIPRITNPADASANIGLAAFAATIHAHDETPSDILDALAGAFVTIAPERAIDYSELVEAGLADTKAGEIWRHLMAIARTPDGSTLIGAARLEGREEGREQGVLEERRRVVLLLLSNRGVPVSDEACERVTACTDPDVLARWLERAARVQDGDQLFDEDE